MSSISKEDFTSQSLGGSVRKTRPDDKHERIGYDEIDGRIYDDDATNEDWSKERVIELISAIKAKPIIWKSHSSDNTNKKERRRAFSDIAVKFKTSNGEVRRKWLTLEASFRRCLKIQLQGGKVQWFGYPLLGFLMERYTRPREETVNYKTKQAVKDENLNSDSEDPDVEVKQHEWTQKASLKLIELYRRHPHLWNSNDPNYNKRSLRRQSLMQIAKIFDVPIIEVKRKFSSMRLLYQRNAKIWSEGKPVKWFAFQSLSYLDDVKNGESYKADTADEFQEENLQEEWLEDAFDDDNAYGRENTSETKNLEDDNDNNEVFVQEYVSDFEDHSYVGENPLFEENHTPYIEESETRAEVNKSNGYQTRSKRQKLSKIEETENKKRKKQWSSKMRTEEEPSQKRMKQEQLQKRAENETQKRMEKEQLQKMMKKGQSRRKDGYQLFGEKVASQLRLLKSKDAINNVQQIIHTILWEAEYGKFDDDNFVTNVNIGFVVRTDNKK